MIDKLNNNLAKEQIETYIDPLIKMKDATILFYCDQGNEIDSVEKYILEQKQFKYVVADNINEAITLFYEQAPDAIIFIGSAQTLEQVGYFYESIRNQNLLISVPVFCCGEYDQLLARVLYAKGIEEFIAFPIENEALFLKVEAKIYKHQQQIKMQQLDVHTGLYNLAFFERIYELQMASLIRTKTPFTLVFISIVNFYELRKKYGSFESNQVFFEISKYISMQIRDSDLAFDIGQEDGIGVILPSCGEAEANAFLKRLFLNIPSMHIEEDICLKACIQEMRMANVLCVEAIEMGKMSLKNMAPKGPSQIEIVDFYKQAEIEKIKVTIIEDEKVSRTILYNLLDRAEFEGFELSIEIFDDGYHFLNSECYLSGHRHIVIMNEILPKMGGFEVLNVLRGLPNAEKYIVMMLTNGHNENAMMYALDKGVDDYITKPFNSKVIESRITRFLRRLK